MRNLNTSPEARGALARSVRIFLLTPVLAAALASSCYGMDPQRALSQYIRDRWGTEQGFPRGSVYAITQTTDGYLWIGTEAGLVRFDGLQFRLIRDQSAALPVTSVLGLTADKDGSLWVRLRDMRVLRYRKGRFDDPFPALDALPGVTAMTTTRGGDLLFARMQMGAFTYHGHGLELFAPAQGVPRSPVLSVAQTADGSVWMATRGAGLFRLRDGRTMAVERGLPDPKVNILLPVGKDLWIGTDNGMAQWNGSAITTSGIPGALGKLQILSLLRDRDANLWVGTDARGLLRFSASGVASLDPGADEPGSAITALFEDREGNLWIGSANGIERLRDTPFVSYSAPEGVPTEGSKPVFVDSENRTWFSPPQGGLWWLKDGRHGRVAEAGLDSDIVYSIAGRKTELWLGRQRGGLTFLRPGPHSFQAKTYTRADGLAQDSVYSVYETREGVVWAGTLSGGVSKFEHGKFTTYTAAPGGLASNTVASILESGDGTLWFATPTGLSSLSQGRWRTYTSADGLPSDNVNCLLQDSGGILWAGTTAGLAFRASDRFQTPAKTPASLREQIFGIAEDREGSLWTTTSNHVVRVNRRTLLDGSLTDGDVRDYGLTDGLRGVHGVKRDSSIVADSLGRIWVSLNRGISVVDPARLTASSVPAIAHIQTISADGSPVDSTGAIRLPAGSQRVLFRYAGLSLSIPDRVRFRYQLEGFDHGWSDPVAEREAVYTNLAPGPYRFRVMASNPDGVWSGQEASVQFSVDPSYWQTWWFRSGLVLFFGLAALAAYQLRLRQLTTRLNLRFEERLAERTRIAQELHDTLLQGFLSASMQVHVAADRLPADSTVKPALSRALDLMRQVIEEGRNAVRGLRSTRSASFDLEEAFAQIQGELSLPEQMEEKPVSFRVVSEGQRMRLHPVLRDEVYRIGREALLNAFRHAKAKQIEIELNYSSSLLRVRVRDDGCGIDPQILEQGRDGHWGLSGMRERADRIGARLRLWSSAKGGTEVELSVPGHIAFRDESKAGGVTRKTSGARRRRDESAEPY